MTPAAFLMALWLAQSGASLKGEVLINHQHPLERLVRVELFRLGQQVADLLTDADGVFYIDGIEAGPYVLSVRSPGFPDKTVDVNVLGKGTSDLVVDLTDRSSGIAGRTVSVQSFRAVPRSVRKALSESERYMSQKRYIEAERRLRAAIQQSPEEGDPYFALSRVYFEQGKWNEAIEAGRQAHLHRHRLADVHLLTAKSYAKIGDASGVASELRRYLDEAPDGTARTDALRILKLLSNKP